MSEIAYWRIKVGANVWIRRFATQAEAQYIAKAAKVDAQLLAFNSVGKVVHRA